MKLKKKLKRQLRNKNEKKEKKERNCFFLKKQFAFHSEPKLP